MANDTAIRVENLSKVFKLFQRPADRVLELLPFYKKRSTDFQALKNVNFEIKKGDFVGILGRNGAGKSTLLKILSQELTPTTGQITVNGTVSLLQLGMGFNPELSGRDNAIFASKILGFSNKEIEKILPEIISFAELGDFIDQPIKTYSTGMYSRLSFAVGINVNPDILIADEVLSVGDIRFSQKCLRKMHEFKQMGKTLILVTHDTNTVGVFCNKAIWLMDGQIHEQGEAVKVSENYNNFMLYGKLQSTNEELTPAPQKIQGKNESHVGQIQIDENIFIDKKDLQWEDFATKPQIADGQAKILRATIIDQKTLAPKRTFSPSDTIYLVFETEVLNTIPAPHFGYVLSDKNGLVALHSNNNICRSTISKLSPGKYTSSFKVTLPHFNNGTFIFSLGLGSVDTQINRVHDVLPIEVVNRTEKAEQKGYCLVHDEAFCLSTSP